MLLFDSLRGHLTLSAFAGLIFENCSEEDQEYPAVEFFLFSFSILHNAKCAPVQTGAQGRYWDNLITGNCLRPTFSSEISLANGLDCVRLRICSASRVFYPLMC